MMETKTSEINRPMNAPGYMRPRQTVLDEPLDLRADRHKVQTPAEIPFEPVTTFVTPSPAAGTEFFEEPSDPEGGLRDEDLVYADMTAEEILGQSSLEVQAEPAEFAADAAPEEDSKPARHKKMTGFQRLILFLLVVFVLLVLATVFLYVTGRIVLPDSVIIVIEKGLKLIQ